MELYLCRRLSDDDSAQDETQWVRFPNEGSLTVGRSANCGLRLSSIHISRSHALLKRSMEEFMVKDQNSLLGIHVNGMKISSEGWHKLKSGDEIEFGRPEEGTSDAMKLNARFVYFVKQASSDVLDNKEPGPSCHASAAFEKVLANSLKRKLAPSKFNKISKLTPTVKKFSDKAASSLQESVIFRENKRLKLMLAEKEKAFENSRISSYSDKKDQSVTNTEEEMTKRKICVVEPTNIESKSDNDAQIVQQVKGSKMKDMKTIEKENKRLKLELEKKEQELKKEIDIRNQKLEEHRKIAKELEDDFKLRYDRKEEELETRLMLEKDMAIEECEAKIQEKEKASTSIESVVNTMENELQCSICSELFIVSTTLNCAHTFCEYCISEWRNVRNICPVCRQPIETVTRSLVLDNYIDKVLENLSSEKRESRMKLIEERKQLVQGKKNSKNPQKTCRRSPRAQLRGRGRSTRVESSTTRVNTRSRVRSSRNSRSPPSPPFEIRTPIVISSSSDEESDDSHVANGYRYTYSDEEGDSDDRGSYYWANY